MDPKTGADMAPVVTMAFAGVTVPAVCKESVSACCCCSTQGYNARVGSFTGKGFRSSAVEGEQTCKELVNQCQHGQHQTYKNGDTALSPEASSLAKPVCPRCERRVSAQKVQLLRGCFCFSVVQQELLSKRFREHTYNDLDCRHTDGTYLNWYVLSLSKPELKATRLAVILSQGALVPVI